MGRILVWGGMIAALAGIVLVAVWGARQVLFLRNPHFVLRTIDIQATGFIRRSEIEDRLKQQGLVVGETNLFAIDLRLVREGLEEWVQIRSAEVGRRLPDTLEVRAYERRAVAQLLRPGGRLLDAEGWILPERLDQDLLHLPVITGVKDGGNLRQGELVDDEQVKAALNFIRLKSTESYGKLLDVAMVQLDYSGAALNVHLRERGTFRDGAQLILPVRNMNAALRRMEGIVLERLRGHQSISYIDCTYERNVPVRP